MSSWDIPAIVTQLKAMGSASSNSDSADIKQDLMQLKFILDDIIDKLPYYEGEEKWYYTRLIDKLK